MTACCFCCYTALVVLTALLGYSMAPAPLEWTTLTWAMVGTTLCSAAANTGNQVTFNPLIFVTISIHTLTQTVLLMSCYCKSLFVDHLHCTHSSPFIVTSYCSIPVVGGSIRLTDVTYKESCVSEKSNKVCTIVTIILY